jgi:hypothetical protein
MKAKEGELIKSSEYKEIVVKEIEFIVNKMEQSNILDDKLYYFSGVQGVLHRVMNFEFNDDLLFAHAITNDVYRLFQQRAVALKQGEAVVKLSQQQLTRLTELTKELLEAVKNDSNVDAVLKKYVVLSYSTTGNGYFLLEKGVLKV